MRNNYFYKCEKNLKNTFGVKLSIIYIFLRISFMPNEHLIDIKMKVKFQLDSTMEFYGILKHH